MGKGSYLGGSTIVKMGSDWMSGRDDPVPPAPSEEEKIAKIAKRAAGQANAKRRQINKITQMQSDEKARVGKRLAARRAEKKNG